MRFPAPWSNVAEEVANQARFPGMEESCERATLAIPPAVHRFTHVVLLEDSPVDVPSPGDWLPPRDGRDDGPDWLHGRSWLDAIRDLFGDGGGVGASIADAVDWKHRKRKRLEAGDLSADPVTPTVTVRLEKVDDE